MSITSGEVIDWAAARDVEVAIVGITDAMEIHRTIVNERVELVRAAIGVALIDNYEQASNTAQLARETLASMAIFPDQDDGEPSREFVEDRVITREQLSLYTRLVSNRSLPMESRLWNTLARADTDVFTDVKSTEFETQFTKALSLKKLRDMVEAGKLTHITGVGQLTERFAREAVDHFSTPEDPIAI